MFGSFPPSALVGLRLQSLLGPGSRHCYGIITLIDRVLMGANASLRQLHYIFEIIFGRHPRVLARNFKRQEVCNEKVRPFRFLPCCSRYRDYLGVRLVSFRAYLNGR